MYEIGKWLFPVAEAERKPQDTRADEVLGTRIPAAPR